MDSESVKKKSQSVMTQFFSSTPNEAQLLQANNSLFAEGTARSQNEQQLYTAWQIAQTEKQKMENIIIGLREQMKSMEIEIEKLRFNQKPRETDSQELETSGDDDLADDTKWIRVKNNKKKRKLADTKSPKRDIQTVNKTSNVAPQSQPKRTYTYKKPPPIIIAGVKNQQELCALIKHSVGSEHFQTKLMNNDTVKINVSSDYRTLTSELKNRNLPWHSYENKQNREIRVMIRNLHHSFQPINIINSLRNQGLQAQNATPKLKWKTKEPLDMFIVSFSKDEDINKIYNIKTICNTSVTVEPLRNNKLIPQCKTCQSFGHTKNYCNKTPRCVKCAGPHLSAACSKPGDVQPKCCHCGKSHPASYRGCEVIKELQKLRDNKNKSKAVAKATKTARMTTQNEPRNPQNSRSYSQAVATGSLPETQQPRNPQSSRSYSQAVATGSLPETQQPKNTSDMLVQIMQMLKDQNLRLNKIESSIKIYNNH